MAAENIHEYLDLVQDAETNLNENYSKTLYDAMKDISRAVFSLREAVKDIRAPFRYTYGYEYSDVDIPENYQGFDELSDEEAGVYYDAWDRYLKVCEVYETLNEELGQVSELIEDLEDVVDQYRTEKSFDEYLQNLI